MPSEIFKFFATTAKGMETLLKNELQSFGAQNLEEGKSGVSFEGSLEVAYRACMGSRVANRILLPLKTFPAPNEDRLYGGVRSIHWTDHLTTKNTLAVDFSTSHSKITHSHYGALKVKDAIVDQFRSLQGERPSVDPLQPDLRINVYLHEDVATVSIDLSGDSLHKRGYRQEGSKAPLKENLAAALLLSCDWPNQEAFLDPMCGSGTLPIEAAMIASKVAPGIGRTYYGFLGWQGHVPILWKRIQQEARDQIVEDKKKLPRIVGYDSDFRSVRTALSNIERAGVRGKVHIEKRDLSQSESILEPGHKGLILVNPPYGERLGETEELKVLYKQTGDLFKQKFKGWDGGIFTGSPELSKVIGLKASRRIVLFNGPIECRLFKYDLY